MKAKEGLYYFGRHRSLWAIWQYENVTETSACGRFIQDFRSYEEAVIAVYQLNGWGFPKRINRQY